MSLALVSIIPQPKTDCRRLVESAINHLQKAAGITDVDDLRYFDMRDLQQVRINLHLALELLAAALQVAGTEVRS